MTRQAGREFVSLPDGSRLGRRVEVNRSAARDDEDLGTLVQAVELCGVPLPVGTRLCRDIDHPMICATLASPIELRGAQLAAGVQIRFTNFNHVIPWAIPFWLIPVVPLYVMYRVIRWLVVGSAPWDVHVAVPTDDGKIRLRTLDELGPNVHLPVAHTIRTDREPDDR